MGLDELAAYFREHDSFFLVSHDAPDPDGLGAQYALSKVLEAMGKRTLAVNSTSCSPRYSFIDRDSIIRTWMPELLDGIDPGDWSAIVLDTHDVEFIGLLADVLLPRVGRIVYIDHHEKRGKVAAGSLILPERSSTCELVYDLAERLGVELPLDASVALFTGMVFDTGWFSYPKTSVRTYEAALDLVRAGVVPDQVRSKLNENSSVGMLILQKLVLSSLRLLSRERIGVQVMTRAMLEESGASYDDAEGLINGPLRCRTVEVSLLFKENVDGKLRCSMRSKGKVNCAHIAQSFGGGGHKTAAGFGCPLPLEAMMAKVLELIETSLN